ncbi:CD44 antigen isoform X2 [Latimeria chalumnae]|uniref:CD44 antigen isoform X2 n=1 Tax=Latimeria chalumnae TaxID=7897 RepID=UPI0003C198A7|nr:PREDICTED: CD44 antigen isoform X2 [Latimeria chalumnae]|eukprot:XP_006002073.1 PREDICTED: CD44 antigen isoform X2 [Latimeria chalumnae]
MRMCRLFCFLTFGFCLLQMSSALEGALNISCRYAGVFHVERNGRYNLTSQEAAELCQSLNTSLATMQQLEKSLTVGFETCRYGWTQTDIAILRIHPHEHCASNRTGLTTVIGNMSTKYDAFCFNASEKRDKVCDPVILKPTSTLEEASRNLMEKGLVSSTPVPDETVAAGITSTDEAYFNDKLETIATTVQPSVNPEADNGQDTFTTTPAAKTEMEATFDKTNPTTLAESEVTLTPYSLLKEPTTFGNEYSSASTAITDQTSTVPLHPKASLPTGDTKDTTASVVPMASSPNPQNTHKDQPSTPNKIGKGRGLIPNSGEEPSTESFVMSTTAISAPVVSSDFPEWLIIVLATVAVLIIVTICIILMSRKNCCGKKKKLVINGTKGSKETSTKEMRMDDINGDTPKSQEMVQLMSKENLEDLPETNDEFTVISLTEQADEDPV